MIAQPGKRRRRVAHFAPSSGWHRSAEVGATQSRAGSLSPEAAGRTILVHDPRFVSVQSGVGAIVVFESIADVDALYRLIRQCRAALAQ
jgi:hypothetical protein